jgi:hypothetical protein
MPFVKTRHPRTFPLWMPKTHFSGFNWDLLLWDSQMFPLNRQCDLFFGCSWLLCHQHMLECSFEVGDGELLLSFSKMYTLHSLVFLAS